MGEAVVKLTTEVDARVHAPLLWVDTLASLERLVIGLGMAAVFGLVIGVLIGMFPLFRAMLNPLFDFISNINPMAILVILFMVFGTGSEAKIALIVFGITPIIIATIVLAIEGLPGQQLIKASTLSATQPQTISYLIIPQIMPNLINVVKANIGYAWVFIIAAESLAGSDGLGYRIALFKRKLALDSILPYVMWISMIGYAMIAICNVSVKRFYPWFNK
jgi:NitT/TauT family transport system permease protein